MSGQREEEAYYRRRFEEEHDRAEALYWAVREACEAEETYGLKDWEPESKEYAKGLVTAARRIRAKLGSAAAEPETK